MADDTEKTWGPKHFIQNTPCARNSFLYGMGGGAVGGFAYFLWTSNPRRSYHALMISFTATVLLYWVPCRYQYAQKRIKQRMINRGLKTHIAMQGTPEAELLASAQEPGSKS
ncbi:PREDICTED: cytochrome c oxidase protein 20 homolog [Branchiostoma belcheri]|uniref:Cytochrome c oxidase assembly protein COX20, mitochondrial n=1 Tax=Branchiostoma belcheri TaxID=7741 RepID=A0A6P4Z467_BRABE|nr:PREDICTED: cytochrome c oxidase protein 20 homolog [Branchiostoma belcheri]